MSASDAWDALSEPWRQCLEEAWRSWCDGSAGVGAVVTDGAGRVVARGRNRRHDPRPAVGSAVAALAGTRFAHAEMCALTELPPGPYDGFTVYTSFEPCLMCAGAIMLAHIPRVAYATADPLFDGMHDWFAALPYAAERRPQRELLGGAVGAFAHVLHVSWLLFWFPASGFLAPHRAIAPRHLALAAGLIDRPELAAVAAARRPVQDAITLLWDELVALQAKTRLAARVLVVDADGHVLLLRGIDPGRPDAGSWWITPGGGVDAGESIADAARRELREETGLAVDDVGLPRFERRVVFEFESELYDQHEHFFCVRTDRFVVDDSDWTDVERRSVLGHRWWSREELLASGETVYPERLADYLADVLASP